MVSPSITQISDQKVKLLNGGKPYFDLLLKLIKEARVSIYIQTYIFDEDETGTKIANALIEASHVRKVKVFLLVDGYASGKLSKEFIASLTNSGIHFQLFEPLFKSSYFYLGRRLHHKIVTVDNVYSLVGGMNISNRYNDMPNQPAWLDWAIFAEGNVSIWLTFICQSRTNKLLLDKSEVLNKQSFRTKGETVLVKINDWVRGKNQITASYLKMISNSKQHIIIMSAYFLPSNIFRKKLRLAVQRGVKVQLILAGKSDIWIAKYAERYMYNWLVKNGMEIYEYQKSILHGKIATCDTTISTVGSYNINGLSAYASVELNLEIWNLNFANQVQNALSSIIEHDCISITQNKIAQYGFISQLRNVGSFYTYKVLVFLFTFYFRKHER